MNEITLSNSADMFMPVMDIRQAQVRRSAIVEFVKGMMVQDRDYGIVPGTGGKPTLLKPGAEKLTTFFGLAPVFVPERITENFGDDGTEPLFFYRYRCELYRNGALVGSGIGSCNSRESKYRYRNAARLCPSCGQPYIIKGNAEYGGGWLCFKKKGGCGAKFKDGDASIESQTVGKVSNPDIADIVNTIDKMAQKRALIAATLIAVNASEFFTQDVEDMTVDAEYSVMGKGEQSQSPTVTVDKPIITSGEGNVGSNGNGKANGDGGDMFKRYAAARDTARKSGKFGGDKHLEAAWAKMFKEYSAGDPANGDKFLTAWGEYVDAHDSAATVQAVNESNLFADALPVAA